MQFDLDQFLTQHEFTPNRTHLAGFMNQCFASERAQEEARRSSRSQTTNPSQKARRPQLLALPGGKAHSSVGTRPGEQLLTVPLDTPTVKSLQDMAWKKQVGMGELLRTIVESYLKAP